MPKKASVRITVTVPDGVHKQVLSLADRIGCSEAAAVRILILRGLESMQAPDNPFRA